MAQTWTATSLHDASKPLLGFKASRESDESGSQPFDAGDALEVPVEADDSVRFEALQGDGVVSVGKRQVEFHVEIKDAAEAALAGEDHAG